MAAVTGHHAPARMVPLSHHLSFSNHSIHVSLKTISRKKVPRRWSRQRRRPGTTTLSALVDSNKYIVPPLNEVTSKSGSSNNYDAIQYAAGATGAGSDTLLSVSRGRNLTKDMQAEAKAMARAAYASIYNPKLLA